LEVLPKIATRYCSGVARMGRLCGALSGAIIRPDYIIHHIFGGIAAAPRFEELPD